MASFVFCRVAAPPQWLPHHHQASLFSLSASDPCSPTSTPGFSGFPSRISLSLRFSAPGGGATQNRRRLGSSARNSKKSRNEQEDDYFAWEALLEQLERDLENDTEGDDEDDITEEDVAELEREIEAAVLDVVQEDSRPDARNAIDGDDSVANEHKEEDGIAKNDDQSWEEEMLESSGNIFDGESEAGRTVKLERWQLQKLAAALEVGKRRVNIKNLAAEVGLDRADVLSFLRNPPLELLTKSVLDDLTGEEPQQLHRPKAERVTPGSSRKHNESAALGETKTENIRFAKPADGVKDWARKKRIRKEYLETFELVYRRTRRPTNAMIENLVQLTNVPRKRILEWFDKRRLKSNTEFSSSRRPDT